MPTRRIRASIRPAATRTRGIRPLQTRRRRTITVPANRALRRTAHLTASPQLTAPVRPHTCMRHGDTVAGDGMTHRHDACPMKKEGGHAHR